jgi:hypothetical protein
MSETITSIVQPANKLKTSITSDTITKTIVNEALKISHVTNPTEIDLVKYVGLLIENLVTKKDIDKLQVFKNVLTLCFPSITNEEMNICIMILESLLSSKLIKKIPLLKYFYTYGLRFLSNFLKNVK